MLWEKKFKFIIGEKKCYNVHIICKKIREKICGRCLIEVFSLSFFFVLIDSWQKCSTHVGHSTFFSRIEGKQNNEWTENIWWIRQSLAN